MQKAWFGLAVLALIGAAWMERYDTTPSQYAGRYFKLDRWTGEVFDCRSSLNGEPGCVR